jgi:TIR domain
MWDVFISHASEDKETVARPLASLLRDRDLEVWYDEFSLKLGDSLVEAIDRGLSGSRYGVLILSPAFFARPWPRRELRGLTTREVLLDQRIFLPVWHQVSAREVAAFSLPLADIYGVRTTLGLADVANRIADAVAPERAAAYGRPTAKWDEPVIHGGFLDPVRPDDFAALTDAFAQPLGLNDERALLLVPTRVTPARDGEVPEGVASRLYRSIAQTVSGFATAGDMLFQVAEDEVGMLIPRESNNAMVTRGGEISSAVNEALRAAEDRGGAHFTGATLSARWTIDIPFWEALRRLRAWVAEQRELLDPDGHPVGLGGYAARLNLGEPKNH